MQPMFSLPIYSGRRSSTGQFAFAVKKSQLISALCLFINVCGHILLMMMVVGRRKSKAVDLYTSYPKELED